LCSLQNVCRKIVYDYRIKVIEVIIKSGIKIDVFGDTWKEYKGIYKDNLIIHNAVSVKEALNVWGHSKIVLNIMTWHKAGMTERVANICLSGAVCLTDSSKYLQRNFSNNENIIMYDLSRLEELPEIINNVLSNARYRENIADNAYMLAKDKHIWEARGKEFMELVG
jgi:spore maturation protein CgeB